MDDAAFEILFLFSAAQGWLAEVKRLDQPADAPKADVYHWLWFGEDSITPLRFRAMTTTPRQQRDFEQATLCFDDCDGELRWLDGNGERVALKVHGNDVLPPVLHLRLHEHFGM